MDALPDELKPYEADIILSRRWFEHARAAALRRETAAADYCRDRGEATLARIDDLVLRDRAAVMAAANAALDRELAAGGEAQP